MTGKPSTLSGDNKGCSMHAMTEPATEESVLIQDLIHEEMLDSLICQPEADALALSLAEAGRTEVRRSWFHSMIAAFPLDGATGLQLMRLAEAYLRTPDAASRFALIRDRLGGGAPDRPVAGVKHPIVRVAYSGLWILQRLLSTAWLAPVWRGLSGPIRWAVGLGLETMGREFVMAQTIELALSGQEAARRGRYSFDMLGEGAVTDQDAQRYFDRYLHALSALKTGGQSIAARDGISVKLSALHPAYDLWHWDESRDLVIVRMKALCRVAREKQVGLNIDAEEFSRLPLGIEVLKTLAVDPELADWDGLGIVIQAYHRQAHAVLNDLLAFLDSHKRRIMVRLVKGAYWDTEIKAAQVLGLPDCPVFTRKAHTDISYLACARLMLRRTDRLYPQFATHNAKTMADVRQMARGFGLSNDAFEFQRLYGMGRALHEQIASTGASSRVYAPIGTHRDLLAYLVRRLLENGANTSFISQLADPALSLPTLIESPLTTIVRRPQVDRPVSGAELFLPRQNAKGFPLDEVGAVRDVVAQLDRVTLPASQGPVVVRNPATGAVIGGYAPDDENSMSIKWHQAELAKAAWGTRSDRGAQLLAVARLYEEHALVLLALLQREAGKTLVDAVGELREAVDFLRYYADQPDAKASIEAGIAVCISPWNFPLAIFTGQIAAALAAGHAVIAKPAEQTSLCAKEAIRLCNQVLPPHVLQGVFGEGAVLGPSLLKKPGIAAVAFTGSTETAQAIRRTLARTDNFAARLIAETGGLNACVVDSTALPEQVVRDVVASAFQSAGQRCSACRVLLVQEELFASVRDMLMGAMALLAHGDPSLPATDVGPVIDGSAHEALMAYINACGDRVLYRSTAPATGTFVPATLVEIPDLDALDREHFGPVLHIMAYRREALGSHLQALMAKGFGLTGAIQSRNQSAIDWIQSRLCVGNLYVNRNQIGAVVESQPFGGEGLSGTGPKAGGPRYLKAFRPRHLLCASAMVFDRSHAPASPTVYETLARLMAEKALEVADTVLEERVCPGPTGEHNRLTEHPRGAWLALGEQTGDLVEAALAHGNAVVWLGPDHALQKVQHPLLVQLAVDAPFWVDALVTLPLDGVLAAVDRPALQVIETRLSQRQGPLVPLVFDLEATDSLVKERHLSVNTAASGGNPELLLSAAQ